MAGVHRPAPLWTMGELVGDHIPCHLTPQLRSAFHVAPTAERFTLAPFTGLRLYHDHSPTAVDILYEPRRKTNGYSRSNATDKPEYKVSGAEIGG